MEKFVYIALFAPLVSSLFAALYGMSPKKTFVGIIASMLLATSFLASATLAAFVYQTGGSVHVTMMEWIGAGDLMIPFGFLVDQVSVTMMTVVTLVSTVVHIYSIGYMDHDKSFNRFFSYLSAFVFSMMILVMSDNFAGLFIGWEGVGVCSWLLIGFWYHKPDVSPEENPSISPSWAANEAFIVNRIADLAMLVGIFVIYWNTGSLQYDVVFAELPYLSHGILVTAAIALFIGAMGKSAQFPLHTWLTDAMEGPTPVSALIHAATMVTADKKAIGEAHFSIAIDTINSVGAIALPKLLEQLGVKNIKLLNGEPTGDFAHTPEPLPENLTGIFDLMKSGNYDAGFVVDPDVDRLGIIDETGNFYGEEYTLAVIADYILQVQKGAVVSNLSSSRILTDVANRYAQTHYQSAVGEVNVVATMKETNAIIGGEGNGGIIYPELHYGRDSLVGIALYLSYLAKQKIKASALRASFPNYFMAKNKIELTPTTNIADIIEHLKQHFKAEKQNDADGLRVDIGSEWFHIRPSNTEPIIRIYTESSSIENAKALATKIMALIKK